MSVDSFSRQVTALATRVTQLFDHASTASPLPAKIESAVFKELGIASEELQVSLEELLQQNEELAIAVEAAALERKRYEDLFQYSSQAYLITSLDGCIQEANPMAAQLIGVPQQFLLGKPLSLYVSEESRSLFRAELWRRQQRDYLHEWEIHLKARNQEVSDVACLTIAIRDHNGVPTGFRWILRDITQQKRIVALERNGQDWQEQLLQQNRSPYLYGRGDVISLDPQKLWYVIEGVVKLTTLTEQGQEVLIGLVHADMFFGAYLTALSIHQATAMSEVRLIPLDLKEVHASAQLAKVVFTKTAQRLRQTEILLSISGERRVRDRLYRLLQFLQAEIGEPVEGGTRLSVRLTHEEIATACCTTRVTTTRLLNWLQQQGKIAFDSKSHIILPNSPSVVSLPEVN